MNKAKVDVGSSPPLDLVSAQAEVAANQEQLIIAETSVKQAEDRLRVLIFDPTVARELERPARTGRFAAGRARRRSTSRRRSRGRSRERADLLRARKDIQNAQTSEKYAGNQRLPDVRLNASYQASGLGGTQVLRTGGFPGTIVGPGAVTPFGSVLGQLFARDYPTWARRPQRVVSDRPEQRRGELRAGQAGALADASSG